MNLVKKNRELIFAILGFIGIILFPPLWILFLIVVVIAVMFEAFNKDSKQQYAYEEKNTNEQGYEDPALQKWREHRKEFEEELVKLNKDSSNDADYSKLKNMAERIPNLLEDVITPKTFYEITGDLTIKTRLYYFQDIDKSETIKEEYSFLKDDFEKAKDICDKFFDRNEYVKVWIIYRTLLQRQVPEEEINKNFPELVSKLKDIRIKEWKYVAWAYYIADEVEKVTGKDSCTKERYKYVEEIFARDDLKKERMLENQSDEFKNDHKLLRKFDPEEIKEKDKEISEGFLKSIDFTKFKSKPKKIKSKIKWKLEDAIKFAKIIQKISSKLPKYSAYSALSDFDEITRKEFQYAGFVRREDYYQSTYGEKFLDQYQDIERISDFLQFEMFDECPIQTAIDNKDIERIIFYSLIEIPKLLIPEIEKISSDDPLKRAPYFSIMFEHMTIILNVLDGLEIFNNDEVFIRSWVFNQILDPIDQGKTFLDYGKNNKKGRPYDKKYIEELWVPLFRLIDVELSNPKKIENDIDKTVQIIGSITVKVLHSYFVGDPEEGYSCMRPVYESIIKEEEGSD